MGIKVSCAVLGGCLALFCSTLPAATLSVSIGYVQWEPDQGPVLSNILPEPADSGLQGVELGIDDNNTTGRFLDHTYNVNTVMASSPEEAREAFRDMYEAGTRLFVVNVTASLLQKMTDIAGADALIFNAGAKDDSLRIEQCHPRLLHTLPSRAMLTDALAQWLKKRQMKKVFLIRGRRNGDKAWATAFKRAADRFGLSLVEEKTWHFKGDLRRTASSELPRFTQSDDYDVVVVADEPGDFGEYVPFNTWLPRPVVGTQGMIPVAWHRVVESWGAAQLQSRFQDLAARPMTGKDYAAWAAIRSIGEAVTRTKSQAPESLRDYLFSDDFQLAGFKGRKLTYRDWNGQLRQPIPLVHPRALVSQSPQPGFLHPKTELDTLGFDEPESECRING